MDSPVLEHSWKWRWRPMLGKQTSSWLSVLHLWCPPLASGRTAPKHTASESGRGRRRKEGQWNKSRKTQNLSCLMLSANKWTSRWGLQHDRRTTKVILFPEGLTSLCFQPLTWSHSDDTLLCFPFFAAHLDSVEHFIHDFQPFVFKLHVLDLKRDHASQHNESVSFLFQQK